jgi:phosphoenolpyruvate synthase/pyruvate phosphate dikinase
MQASFILPLFAATDAASVGPKAANLAALARAGLPTPGGFCVTADAYRRQIEHLGLGELVRQYHEADQPTQRRLAVDIRLKLYQEALAPDLYNDVIAAWNVERKPAAVRSWGLMVYSAAREFSGDF